MIVQTNKCQRARGRDRVYLICPFEYFISHYGEYYIIENCAYLPDALRQYRNLTF